MNMNGAPSSDPRTNVSHQVSVDPHLPKGLTLLTPVHLVRKATAEVRIKLPVKLRLHQHHPQRIEASARCCVLAVPFSFGC